MYGRGPAHLFPVTPFSTAMASWHVVHAHTTGRSKHWKGQEVGPLHVDSDGEESWICPLLGNLMCCFLEVVFCYGRFSFSAASKSRALEIT